MLSPDKIIACRVYWNFLGLCSDHYHKALERIIVFCSHDMMTKECINIYSVRVRDQLHKKVLGNRTFIDALGEEESKNQDRFISLSKWRDFRIDYEITQIEFSSHSYHKCPQHSVRVHDCHPRGRGFESHPLCIFYFYFFILFYLKKGVLLATSI